MIGVVARNTGRFMEQFQLNMKLRNDHIKQWEKRETDGRIMNWNEPYELDASQGKYFSIHESPSFEETLADNLMNVQFKKNPVKKKSEGQNPVKEVTQKVDKVQDVQTKKIVSLDKKNQDSNQLSTLNMLYALYGVNPYSTGQSGILANGNVQSDYGMYTRFNPFYTVVPTLDKLY